MTSDGIQNFKNRFPFVWNLLTAGFLIIEIEKYKDYARLITVMLNIMTFQKRVHTNWCEPPESHHCLGLT